jgi:hypothetical protein
MSDRQGLKLQFKSAWAERRHVLCVGNGRGRTHAARSGKSGVWGRQRQRQRQRHRRTDSDSGGRERDVWAYISDRQILDSSRQTEGIQKGPDGETVSRRRPRAAASQHWIPYTPHNHHIHAHLGFIILLLPSSASALLSEFLQQLIAEKRNIMQRCQPT